MFWEDGSSFGRAPQSPRALIERITSASTYPRRVTSRIPRTIIVEAPKLDEHEQLRLLSSTIELGSGVNSPLNSDNKIKPGSGASSPLALRSFSRTPLDSILGTRCALLKTA